MNPMVAYGLMKGGGALLGWLGGGGDRRRMGRVEEEYDWARQNMANQAGAEPFDPWGIYSAARRGIAGDVAARGAQVDRELGLDTGQGQGALWGDILGQQAGTLANLLRERDLQKYQRGWQVAAQLLSSAGNRWGAMV